MKKPKMSFKIGSAILFMSVFIFTCDVTKTTGVQAMSLDELCQELEAKEKLAEAEFYEGLPTTEDAFIAHGYATSLPAGETAEESAGDAWELSFDELGQREQLAAIAYTAGINQDMRSLENYLNEHNITKDIENIDAKYNLADIRAEIAHRTNSASRSASTVAYHPQPAPEWMWSLRMGDIILSKDPYSLYDILVPGYYQHAGIYDTRGWGNRSDLRILTASAVQETHDFDIARYGDLSNACIGYESVHFYGSVPVTHIYRVSGSTSSQCENALDYGKQFHGIKYDILASKTSNTGWYCSKLVYRCWLSQGYNIQNPLFYIYILENWKWKKVPVYGAWVTPDELGKDSNTTRFR